MSITALPQRIINVGSNKQWKKKNGWESNLGLSWEGTYRWNFTTKISWHRGTPPPLWTCYTPVSTCPFSLSHTSKTSVWRTDGDGWRRSELALSRGPPELTKTIRPLGHGSGSGAPESDPPSSTPTQSPTKSHKTTDKRTVSHPKDTVSVRGSLERDQSQ